MLPLALFCSVLISNMSGDWIAAKLIWVVLAYAFASERWQPTGLSLRVPAPTQPAFSLAHVPAAPDRRGRRY